jgi:plasmid replication initiation protein
LVTKQEEKTFLIKAEGNFEDHPYFTVGNQRGGEGVIQYTNTIRTRDGQELRQTWTVRAVQGLGLPGTLDQDVYVALLQLIDRQGDIPEDGWIGFSLYELVECLHRTHGGRDYRQVKESLDRLSGTIIQSRNAFYRKSTKSYLDDTFHLLDRVQHSESTDASGKRGEKSWIKLSDYFVESYKANYLKGLDADFYWSLNSAVAKRLYRFVDKKRGQQRRWEVALFALRDRIPLSPYKYPSKIKEKLGPAHDELRKKGFLERVTYRNTAEGADLVCYEIQEGFTRRRPTLQVESSPEVLIAVERLKAEGVRLDVGRELVAKHGPERCLRYSEAVTFQKNIRNRAGWLRWAIEQAPELDLPAPAAPMPFTEKTEPLPEAIAEDAETELLPSPIIDPRAATVWDPLVERASEELNSPSLRVWFEDTVPTAFDGSTLTLQVPNAFAKQYIEERFGEIMRRVLREQIGTDVGVEIKCWQDNGG